MLRRLMKRSNAQSTAEYAVVVGFVVAAIVAMQIYVRRGLQAKVRVATDHVGDGLLDGGITEAELLDQYEPYYAKSSFPVTQSRKSHEAVKEGYIVEKTDIEETTTRTAGGFSEQAVDMTKDNKWKELDQRGVGQ